MEVLFLLLKQPLQYKIIPVDVKIPGNPPEPVEILKGLLALMKKIREQ